jgi:valyl-tRNA synthetase
MEKRFDPKSYESKWQSHWSEQGYFEAASRSTAPSYCIMIPPPNVTGRLHVGHALQSTLQDLLTRWRRMHGDNALWLPGTDHAGIATQLMVERQVAAEGASREAMGRDAFLERMWQWKEEHHGNIRRQLDKLGASCDWSRERFTLDEGLSAAVREAFVRLYREGLIHRGEYMVNWSPGLNTAISDLEVDMKTVAGKLYHIAYPVEGSDERIVVATTRPETMLGDTAVAMHPEDERYAHLRGKAAIVPLVDRRAPFVADEVVEPQFGTGLVKVTPAHDPADFEIGERHGLERIQVIDREGRMTAAAGPDFEGLDRDVARLKVVEMLAQRGHLVDVEDYTHNVGHCHRSGVPIEPLVSTQWFCDVSSMAAQAVEAVATGELELIPATWDKTWNHWLENIRPWCISRQLWWGHRIPAWYTEDGRCIVAHSRAEAAREAGTERLTRDPDVLDTWFSSGLWPFSTLGWPEETDDLLTFFPTDVLITGFDILFFWVARMVMLSKHFTGRSPFAAVHLTGLVRDAQGRKMSKTTGNTVDPLELVDEFGADAVRFTLAILDSPGRDIPLDRQRMAGYRSFGNKIWNATRFVLSRIGEARVVDDLDPGRLDLPERWILSRFSKVAGEVDRRLAEFRFDEACRALYQFFWGDLCDWYIEISKPALSGEAPRPRAAEVLVTVLERSLRLLHPMMPFLTEELWQRLPGREAVHPETICLAPYPSREEDWEDPSAESWMELFTQVVSRVRNVRAELDVPPKVKMTLHLQGDDAEVIDAFAQTMALSGFLCRLAGQEVGEAPAEAFRDRIGSLTIGLTAPERNLGEEQRELLARQIAEVEKGIASVDRLLDNPEFVAKAPAKLVDSKKSQRAELVARLESLRSGGGEETTAGGN